LIGVEEGGVSFVNEEVASIAGLKVAQGVGVGHVAPHGVEGLHYEEGFSAGLAEEFFGGFPVVVGEAPGAGPGKP
jgi:hypothetical protein